MYRKLIYLVSFILVLGLVGTNSALGVEIDIRITNGNDDVEQHVSDGRIDRGSSDLELAHEDAGNPATDEQIIGLRFVNVPLPKGAQVTSAYVEFEVDKVNKEGSTYPVNLVIEGELTPDASPFESVANNITDRPSWTTAKVKWSIPPWTAVNEKFQTSDISSIIQEIINQDGWASGNALVLIFRDDKDNPSTGLREAESRNGEADAAPLLHITALVKVAGEPNPANGAKNVPIDATLGWTPGDTAATHDVYFGTSSPPAFIGNQTETSYVPGLLNVSTTYYWRIDEVEADGTTKHTGSIWSFTTVPGRATQPNPADGAGNIPVNTTILSWEPGPTADTHDLYFGTSSPPPFIGNQAETSYDPGFLKVGTTYYWQVDEIEADGTTKHTGDVWSFTTAPTNILVHKRIATGNDDVEERLARNGDLSMGSSDLEFPYEDVGQGDPQRVGMRFVNIAIPPGAQITNAYIEFEVDETKGGTEPVNVIIDGQLTGDAEPFVDVAYNVSNRPSWTTAVVPWSVPNWTAKNVKWQTPDISVLVQEIVNQPSWADGNAMVFTIQDDPANPSLGVRCAESYNGEASAAPLLHIEAVTEKVYNTQPANGAIGLPLDTTVSWWPGMSAETHDVYFGTSSPPPFIGNQVETSYDPGPLDLGTTYYWQIDEVEADGTTKHTGDIFSFTTVDSIVVEDFESYSLAPPTEQVEIAAAQVIVAVPPDPAGLLMHWALDGTGPQIMDNSGKGNMGFLIGGATRATPGYDGTGGALQCGGIGDHALGLNPDLFNGLDAMTMSVWVKSNTTDTDAGFFHGEQPAGNDDRGMRYDKAGYAGGGTNVVKIGVTSTGGLQQLESSSGVQTTEWQHLAMTWSSGNQLALYVDGVLDTPTYNDPATTGTLTGYTKLFVGKGAKDDQPTESWNGLIDDLRVYNSALTYGQIRSLAGKGDLQIPAVLGPLLAHYEFEGNTNDSSGNGYDGVPQGGPTYAAGAIGDAIELDGVDDYVVVGKVGISGKDPRTIAGWAKATSLTFPQWVNVFGFTGPSGTNKHFDIELVGDTSTTTHGWYGIHVYGWEYDILPVDLEWHHLAASYDGATIKWYGDGQLIGSAKRSLDTPDNVHMGKRFDNSNYFPGLVDDVRIYNYAMPGAEIASLAGIDNPLSNTWLDSDGVISSLELDTTHGGAQAMTINYNTTPIPYGGEVSRTPPFADWTTGSAQVLSLWFYGDPGNSVEKMYVKLNNSDYRVEYAGDPADIQKGWWTLWNIDLASLGVNPRNVKNLSIGFCYGTMGGGTGTVRVDDIRLYRVAPTAPVDLWFEAELADTLGANWRLYDDPTSSGGKHIGSDNGDGNDNNTAPGPEWVATYNFTAPAGVYKILIRAISPSGSDDSCWVRIPTATSQTYEDPDQPGTGWVRFNDIDESSAWHWDEVHSDDHGEAVVNWTLSAGQHTLEIAKREDGVYFDAIWITDNLGLDQATLPDVLP